MAHDYRGFQDKINGDLSQASAAASSMERGVGGKGSKVRLRQSDMENLIPSGASVEFIAMPPHRLKFGDIIFVRINKEFSLRRFVGFEIGKNGMSTVSVAKPQPPSVERHPDTAVLGKVVKVEHGGKSYDPHKAESAMAKLRNQWTCFGTSTPLARITRGLGIFSRRSK